MDREEVVLVASSLILVLALTVPLVGERILPGGPGDITDTETIDRITTGRSVLWEDLWRRGAEALPWGNGWGYMWSLTPIDLFGFEGAFTTGDNPFVYPHNDFLFVFLELGILGLGLLIGFWIQLLRRIRLVSRAHDEAARFGVRVLVPVLVVGLLVQLFDNGFAIRPVAERFFLAAGLVLGLIFSWQRSAAESVVISPLGARAGMRSAAVGMRLLRSVEKALPPGWSGRIRACWAQMANLRGRCTYQYGRNFGGGACRGATRDSLRGREWARVRAWRRPPRMST